MEKKIKRFIVPKFYFRFLMCFLYCSVNFLGDGTNFSTSDVGSIIFFSAKNSHIFLTINVHAPPKIHEVFAT